MKKRTPSGERGISLIIAMLALLVLSTLAAAIIFVTQTETWNSSNYKFLTQARYAAEAGAQTTQNWMINTYTVPTAAQLAASYDTTKSPVVCTAGCANVGQPVVLGGASANYPDTTVKSAFNTALSSQTLTGLSNASYSTTATLMQASATSMTWKIASQGTVTGVRSAQVQVVATIENTNLPTYGIAGLGNSCGDVTFTGGTMKAWNSSLGTYAATQQLSGGNIGTNGNVTLSGGSTRIYGTINDSSNTTVGNCPDGITNNVGGTPWAGLNQLNAPLSYPVPPAPSPMTSTTNLNVNSNTCWGASPAGCTVIAGPAIQIAPGSYGDVTSNSNIHLSAGTYDINSLNLNGGSVTLDSVPVTINLGGNGVSAGGTLFASQSSTVINDGGIPSNLIITSAAGLGLSNPPVITMNASSSMYAVVDAPYAYVHITGSSTFLGAVIGKKVTCDSSGGFAFDLALQNLFKGPYNLLSFTWSKY